MRVESRTSPPARIFVVAGSSVPLVAECLRDLDFVPAQCNEAEIVLQTFCIPVKPKSGVKFCDRSVARAPQHHSELHTPETNSMFFASGVCNSSIL